MNLSKGAEGTTFAVATPSAPPENWLSLLNVTDLPKEFVKDFGKYTESKDISKQFESAVKGASFKDFDKNAKMLEVALTSKGISEPAISEASAETRSELSKALEKCKQAVDSNKSKVALLTDGVASIANMMSADGRPEIAALGRSLQAIANGNWTLSAIAGFSGDSALDAAANSTNTSAALISLAAGVVPLPKGIVDAAGFAAGLQWTASGILAVMSALQNPPKNMSPKDAVALIGKACAAVAGGLATLASAGNLLQNTGVPMPPGASTALTAASASFWTLSAVFNAYPKFSNALFMKVNALPATMKKPLTNF